ncbi:MAG: FAD-binding oxidoreductase [Gammaproteobacteria bacterium]
MYDFKSFLKRLSASLPNENILTDSAECVAYSYDNSRHQHLPECVVFATDAKQITVLLNLCNQYSIPITPRGRGTGTTGAAIPLKGGVLLSLERMNKITQIDSDNRVLIAEPGVTNEAVQQAAKKHGFFWAPDPSSSAYCTIGGNLACNAAGPHAIKYGTTRENTLGLSAITGAGDFIKTGVYTTKGVVGYDFTRLLIGSEGTLGIITEAILKLTPLPESSITLQVFFNDLTTASRAISSIMGQSITPSALEFVDSKALAMISDYAKVTFPINAKAMLIIEIDGLQSILSEATKKITDLLKQFDVLNLEITNTPEATKKIWQTRKALSPALRTIAPNKINEDIVVPVSNIPQFINGVENLSKKYEITIVNFGHAGNGNIHVNLLFDAHDAKQNTNAKNCLDEIFTLVLNLKGTLSGEHGIGIEKQFFVSREMNPATLKLMQQIKKQFDPNNILNPGKIPM